MSAWNRTFVASAAIVALMSVPTRGALGPTSRDGLPPNYDVRSAGRTQAGPVAPDVRSAVDALRADVGGDADVRITPRGTLRMVASRGRPLGRLADGDPAAALRAFLAQYHRAFGLDGDDARSLVPTREVWSGSDGLTHLDFAQFAAGLRIFGAGMRVHATRTGHIVRVSSTAVRTTSAPDQPALTAAEATAAAVAFVRPDLEFVPRLVRGPAGASRESVFARGPLASDPVASLELFPMGGELRIAWHVVVEPAGPPQKFDVLVDGVTGELLYRHNRVLYAEGTGRVLQSDQARARDSRAVDAQPLGSAPPSVDAPLGCPPTTNHLSRDLTAPFRDQPTVLSGTGRLEGNNAHVYRGAPGVEGATGSVAAGGGLVFDFDFGTAGSAETHLFFVANFLHDFFYDLGFDEVSGNFQADNFGRGGAPGDPLAVVARADGRNNATFEPKPDGQSPIMSMFLWDGSNCWAADVDGDGALDLDGAFDSDIVIHEYHHGVSTRLNPQWSGDEADAAGEGGSDFFAYSVNGNTLLAEFAYPPTGIRQVNGRTYGSWDCLLGIFCEPHDNGEIWANLLWDVRERYRADLVGGSEQAAVHQSHQVYVDGIKLSAPWPTLLDLRDAMLQADRLRHPSADPGGSDNACRLWETFAWRGMGANARDTVDTGSTYVVEDFTVAPPCPALPARATVTIAATDASAAEAGPDPGTFTITRTGDTARPLTVYLGAPSGSAAEGIDYLMLPGSVAIPAGASSATLQVVPIDDTLVESNETVSLGLMTGPAYGLGSPASATVTIASDDVAPDLVVSALTGTSAGGAGRAIAVNETTKNQGTGPSDPSITRYYLSTNTLADDADVVIGSRDVPGLAAGASSATASSLAIPADTPTGTYYVIARADAAGTVGESAEGNNTRYFQLRIGPDLVIAPLTVPGTGAPGGSLAVTETTKNQGGGDAAGSGTAFYLSSNTAFDAGDVLLGSRAVPALAAGAASSATTTITLPADAKAGTWYVLARADNGDAVAETLETNNLAFGQVKVGPDLIVSPFTGPTTGGAGSALAVSDTTKNQGGAASSPSVTRFYLSQDITLDAGDVVLGQRAVAGLAAGGSSVSATTLTVPAGTATGAYYVLAQADADNANDETSETNNGARISVRIGPDLIVSGVTAPTTSAPGTAVSIGDTVKNQGGGSAGASAARLFLSVNSTLDPGDVLLGTHPVPALAAGKSAASTTSVTVPAGTPAGVYYVIVQADGASEVSETSETNNTATAQTRLGPDFVVAALTVSPVNSDAGGVVTVTDTTSNTGGAAGPETTTGIYLSADTVFDAADTLLASRSVPALPAAGKSTGSTVVTLPAGTAIGTWQLIAVADAGGIATETNEANNTRATYVRVGPDLKIASGRAPSKVTAGTAFSVTESTTNAGGGTAGASSTRYYLSANSALDAGDVLLGSRAVAALAAGATSSTTVTLTVPAGTAKAVYYLLLVADGDGAVAEVYENNNVLGLAFSVN